MSSTRRAKADAPLSQERFMSSEEYADLRGIKGMPAATKAALVKDPQIRRLLFWLQDLSLEPGRLAEVGPALVGLFPENLGTPKMRDLKLKPGMRVSAEEAEQIKTECRFTTREAFLHHTYQSLGCSDELLDQPADKVRSRVEGEKVEGATLIALCRRSFVARLPDYLVQICINPFVLVSGGDEPAGDYEQEVGDRIRDDGGGERFQPAEIVHFRDLVPCLIKLMKQDADRARTAHALTSVGSTIWKGLDFCLKTGELIVVEGREGIGKTEAVKAWCAAHAGQVRYVSLASTNSPAKFFRELARSCGTGSSYGYKSSQMEARVVDFLRRSRQMLVVDEGHYLLPQGQRAIARPLLLDFLYSALNNHGVPVALICTPQFSLLATNVERRTGWNADQFLRRSKRFFQLPKRLESDDLLLVARALLPGASETMAKLVAAYASMKEHQLDAIKDLARESRMLAEEAGREQIKTTDLERAMKEVIEPTLLAKVRAMGRLKVDRNSAPGRRVAGQVQAPCSVTELPPQRGTVKVSGRGIMPAIAEAEEEFADAPALAG